jgi:hypothetical protein
LKKKRIDPRDERRRSSIEINLMGEPDSGPKATTRSRRGGCSLPLTGGLLILAAIDIVRAVLG